MYVFLFFRSLDAPSPAQAPPAATAAAAAAAACAPANPTVLSEGKGAIVVGDGGGGVLGEMPSLSSSLLMTSAPPDYWADKVDAENTSLTVVKNNRRVLISTGDNWSCEMVRTDMNGP